MTKKDILHRLDSYNAYCENADSMQLRKDAAEEIRRYRDAIEMVCDGYDLPPQVKKVLESALKWSKE